MAGMGFNGIPIPLVASAARTSTGNSGNLKNTSTYIPVFNAAAFILDVTTVTGTTPLLDVAIETSVDGGTTWYMAWAYAQVTAASTLRLDVRDTGIGFTEIGATSTITLSGTTAIVENTVITQDVRILWTIAGTSPSFTFAVWGIFQPLGSQF